MITEEIKNQETIEALNTVRVNSGQAKENNFHQQMN